MRWSSLRGWDSQGNKDPMVGKKITKLELILAQILTNGVRRKAATIAGRMPAHDALLHSEPAVLRFESESRAFATAGLKNDLGRTARARGARLSELCYFPESAAISSVCFDCTER